MQGKRKIITQENREEIEKMLAKGYEVPAIAGFLEFSRQSIYRELQRCAPGRYRAAEAQKTAVHSAGAAGGERS